jgi:uncharacterized protein
MDRFRFTLSEQEKRYLKEVARLSIESGLKGEELALPEPVSPRMVEHLGAFVTLKIRGCLRGCIGHILGDQPLNRTVATMARCAAFEDPRFAPLTFQELREMEMEISILSPFEQVDDLERIEPGRHGLMIQQGFHSGLLLPQVATEWGWDRETFLTQTCRKAGLPSNAWQNKKTAVYWFEAEVF